MGKKIKNEEPVKEVTVEEVKTGLPEVEPVTSMVGEVNTIRLNVRANPSKASQVVKVIAEGDKVNIDLAKSTDDFYAIDDGFVMKQFITV